MSLKKNTEIHIQGQAESACIPVATGKICIVLNHKFFQHCLHNCLMLLSKGIWG